MASKRRCSACWPIRNLCIAAKPEPAGLAAGKSYRISDLALASRLSFFLWSSVPDDELIDLAAQGKLKDPAVLEKQVRRMLADPKSEALITNFTGQWLGVRSLKTSEPVVNLFPDFDDNLRAAYKHEIELFFGSIVHEDRSILDLLTANYTFVNERLAKQYGIPNIYGSQFRRGDVACGTRHAPRPAGQGRAADRNVECGAHFARHPGQVVPANVPRRQPAGPAAERAGAQGTSRWIPPATRSRRPCARPWKRITPIRSARRATRSLSRSGWRSKTSTRSAPGARRMATAPSMPRGVLVDGTKVDGVASLRDSLVRRSDQFVRVVTEKMLTYALGRGVEYQDMPLVRSIVRESAAQQLQILFHRVGYREERPVPDEYETAAPARAQERAAR